MLDRSLGVHRRFQSRLKLGYDGFNLDQGIPTLGIAQFDLNSSSVGGRKSRLDHAFRVHRINSAWVEPWFDGFNLYPGIPT